MTPEHPEVAQGSRDFWSHAKVAELKQLWGMGLSHGAIAIVMGISKGKVSAKLDRLDLNRARPVVDGRSFAAERPRVGPERMADYPGRKVPLLQLTGCKAATAYDGEHLFCDEPKVAGRSYCECHLRIATRQGVS